MKKLFLLIPTALLLSSCGASNNSSKNTSNSVSEEESSSESSSSEPYELTEQVASFTFKTEISDNTWPSGALADGSGEKNHLFILKNKLNEEKELFKEITQETTFFNNNSEFKTWIYGNQTSGGYVEFTTNYEVIKIEVEVQTYYKYNSYAGTMNFDGETIFSVEDQEIDLRTEEVVGSSELKKQSFDFKDGITKFRLSSTGGRTFLNKLTITYMA